MLLVVLCSAATGQQTAHLTSGMIMNYRDGGPLWPNVVDAPNNGLVLGAIYGAPTAPFGILYGSALAPGAVPLPNGDSIDLLNPVIFGQSFSPTLGAYQPSFVIPPFGVPASGGYSPLVAQAFLPVFFPPGTVVALPPVQAVVVDPLVPYGYAMSGATQLTLRPSNGVLFIQGNQDPFGFGPQCRLSDTSLLGLSHLRLNLFVGGFPTIDEFVHDSANLVTAALLAPYKVVVLAANRTPFTTNEINLLETFVRNGGGLIAFADSTFGIDGDPANPGGYVATCDPYTADNDVLARFGLEILPDNFNAPTTFTSFVGHPTTRGLPGGFMGEGMSLVRIVGGTADVPTLAADCASNACGPLMSGCGAGMGTPTTTGPLATCEAGLGRVVVTCDRNTFLNPPGIGTHLYAASNLVYAMNLFFWTAGMN
jgi:hypothetical protein